MEETKGNAQPTEDPAAIGVGEPSHNKNAYPPGGALKIKRILPSMIVLEEDESDDDDEDILFEEEIFNKGDDKSKKERDSDEEEDDDSLSQSVIFNERDDEEESESERGDENVDEDEDDDSSSKGVIFKERDEEEESESERDPDEDDDNGSLSKGVIFKERDDDESENEEDSFSKGAIPIERNEEERENERDREEGNSEENEVHGSIHVKERNKENPTDKGETCYTYTNENNSLNSSTLGETYSWGTMSSLNSSIKDRPIVPVPMPFYCNLDPSQITSPGSFFNALRSNRKILNPERIYHESQEAVRYLRSQGILDKYILNDDEAAAVCSISLLERESFDFEDLVNECFSFAPSLLLLVILTSLRKLPRYKGTLFIENDKYNGAARETSDYIVGVFCYASMEITKSDKMLDTRREILKIEDGWGYDASDFCLERTKTGDFGKQNKFYDSYFAFIFYCFFFSSFKQ